MDQRNFVLLGLMGKGKNRQKAAPRAEKKAQQDGFKVVGRPSAREPKEKPKWSITLATDDDDDEDHHDGHGDDHDVGEGQGSKMTKLKTALTPLQKKLKDDLSGSRFRMLNESLYTQPSSESFRQFQKDPHLFAEYHNGFREQAKKWSNKHNPVTWIAQRLQNRFQKQKGVVVADFGCGDATLAKTLPKRFTVHSLDLVAGPGLEDIITPCNIADVNHLDEGTVDVGVYSLALMSTDIFEILHECSRLLRVGGRVYIAEVRSRFTHTKNMDMQRRFIRLMEGLGFECEAQDARRENKYFVLMEFKKVSPHNKGLKKDDIKGIVSDEEESRMYLKPCIYKRR